MSYLKFNRDEITWIDPVYLTREVAKDILGFWLDTQLDKLCTAREEADGSIAHYWFNGDTNQWEFLKKCSE